MLFESSSVRDGEGLGDRSKDSASERKTRKGDGDQKKRLMNGTGMEAVCASTPKARSLARSSVNL